MGTTINDGDDNDYCYHHFPLDVASEILRRLPVDSLLRFKCVCKNWYALINNPSFISEHFNCNKNKRPKLLIYNLRARNDDSVPITFISDDINKIEATPFVGEKPDFFRGKYFPLMVGCVDGLFLLMRGWHKSDEIRLSLWNPATREMTTLPDVDFQLQPFFAYCTNELGFGLDPITNNYKVVWFRMFFEENIDGGAWFPQAYAAVYSCSTDSWRIINHSEHKIATDKSYRDACCSSSYLNGAYYWLQEGQPNCNLLSFNFGSEVFEEVRGPDNAPANNCRNLILFDDSITILAVEPETQICDFWVLTQPGVWNKLVTFQCLDSRITSSYDGLWDSSTFIFLSESDLLLESYDIRTHETKSLGYHLQACRSGLSIYHYKESLVTVKLGSGQLNRPSSSTTL